MLTKSIVKKVSSFRSIGKWVFWNPCFTTDCREVYIMSLLSTLVPISFSNHQGLGGLVAWSRADNRKVAGSIPAISTKPTLMI